MLKTVSKTASKLRVVALTLTTFGLLATASQIQRAQAQDVLVKNGEKIAFLGDSITQQGWDSNTGYVRLVIAGLAANGIKAEPIPAGISGHKSNDMLARLDRDVIAKKPDWMTLSCGVNDVWHQERNVGILIDQYKQNITAIVDKAQAANIKVMLLTSTMIREDQGNANNQKLIAYNDFLRSLAAERKLPLADLNAEMQNGLKAAPEHKGNWLTGDGVHMNPLGNVMMATGVLKAFGLNEAQLQKAREAWDKLPQNVGASISLRQYADLSVLAAKQNRSVNDLVNEALAKAIDSLAKN